MIYSAKCPDCGEKVCLRELPAESTECACGALLDVTQPGGAAGGMMIVPLARWVDSDGDVKPAVLVPEGGPLA